MKISRIKAIAKKELIQIRRDPLSLAMAFLMPVMLLFIFGYAITLDANNLETVVCDLDKSTLSRELVAEFGESEYFTIIDHVYSQGEIDGYLDRGEALVAITIPQDFSEDIKKGRPAELQVIVDGSDSNSATIALGYISGVTGRFFQKDCRQAATPLIDTRMRVWFNESLNPELHHPGSYCGDHVRYRGTSHLPHCCARVGEGDHGAAHINACEDPGVHPRKTHTVLPDRLY